MVGLVVFIQKFLARYHPLKVISGEKGRLESESLIRGEVAHHLQRILVQGIKSKMIVFREMRCFPAEHQRDAGDSADDDRSGGNEEEDRHVVACWKSGVIDFVVTDLSDLHFFLHTNPVCTC